MDATHLASGSILEEAQGMAAQKPSAQLGRHFEDSGDLGNMFTSMNGSDFGSLNPNENSKYPLHYEPNIGGVKETMAASTDSILDPNKHLIVCFQETTIPIRDRGIQINKKKDGGSKEKLLSVRNNGGSLVCVLRVKNS